ncbi:hypothetical protein HJC23_006118 [Cyclotella cryptica]|uniref:Uncharacterized protein n=1 Tax=Cyclotella cryptica TaxID=29204 RepID=A0ABD3QL95_9STRA
MTFDLLDDAMLNDGFSVDDASYGFLGVSGLVLDEMNDQPHGPADRSSLHESPQDRRPSVNREHSWDELVRCVSDQSDDEITNYERDELQEFLKDVGILETPISTHECFECWGATISPVSEEQQIEPVGNTPFAYDPMYERRFLIDRPMPPPEKRRKVQMQHYPICPVTPIPPVSTMMSIPMPPVITPPIRRKGKDTNKNRTTRQFVPFEEMQRLMAEYGPIKTPRKRKIKDVSSDENGTGGTAKMESIKRKFYRWFPDFEERFVKNPDGFTYRPKAGHDKEVAYRVAMRNMDQEILVHKRKVGRKSGGNLSNCKGGCPGGEQCVGNPFSQPVSDSECSGCARGQYWWPCNFETLCFCANVEDGAPRVPPAPSSGVTLNDELSPCEDVLTEDVFNAIVQPGTDEGKAVFTYLGLCNAIDIYNRFHDEKFAMMGTEEQIRAELAAFLAHAAADTGGFSLLRDSQQCTNPITGSDGKVYCAPCKEENFDKESLTCNEPWIVSDTSYKEFCDSTRQGDQGCNCNNVTMATVPGYTDAVGYIAASDAYFPRGAIITQWNYDYLGASLSLTGDPSILCDNPDLIATDSQYTWGAGIVKFMEKMQFGTTGETAHKQIMKGNFGGSVEVLYGDLECPSNEWTSLAHVDLVKARVSQVCKAGAALGVFIEMDQCDTPSNCVQCDGLKELYDSCQQDGSCPDCSSWTQFVKSSAPTVTPLRVQPPSWEDWSNSLPPRSAAAICFNCSHIWSVAVTVSISLICAFFYCAVEL